MPHRVVRRKCRSSASPGPSPGEAPGLPTSEAGTTRVNAAGTALAPSDDRVLRKDAHDPLVGVTAALHARSSRGLRTGILPAIRGWRCTRKRGADQRSALVWRPQARRVGTRSWRGSGRWTGCGACSGLNRPRGTLVYRGGSGRSPSGDENSHGPLLGQGQLLGAARDQPGGSIGRAGTPRPVSARCGSSGCGRIRLLAFAQRLECSTPNRLLRIGLSRRKTRRGVDIGCVLHPGHRAISRSLSL
jgi:hypothetical protein